MKRKEIAFSYNTYTVYRTSVLPQGQLRGIYFVTEPVITATRDALTSFALAGIYDGGHEGIVYWAGREFIDSTVFLQAIIPNAEHSAGRVMVNRDEIGRTERAARRRGLGVLCQVHSHPGADARHSEGDDRLVLLPFENMLSIVTPQFGLTFSSMEQACVHQYQNGQWVLCKTESVTKGIHVIPSTVDLR